MSRESLTCQIAAVEGLDAHRRLLLPGESPVPRQPHHLRRRLRCSSCRLGRRCRRSGHCDRVLPVLLRRRPQRPALVVRGLRGRLRREMLHGHYLRRLISPLLDLPPGKIITQKKKEKSILDQIWNDGDDEGRELETDPSVEVFGEGGLEDSLDG